MIAIQKLTGYPTKGISVAIRPKVYLWKPDLIKEVWFFCMDGKYQDILIDLELADRYRLGREKYIEGTHKQFKNKECTLCKLYLPPDMYDNVKVE